MPNQPTIDNKPETTIEHTAPVSALPVEGGDSVKAPVTAAAAPADEVASQTPSSITASPTPSLTKIPEWHGLRGYGRRRRSRYSEATSEGDSEDSTANDDEAIHWRKGTEFHAGEVVWHKGRAYRAKQSHTGSHDIVSARARASARSRVQAIVAVNPLTRHTDRQEP